MSSELVARYESDLPYDANPKQTVEAIAALHERVAKFQREEPGNYKPVSPVPEIRWSTENCRSRWVLSLSLYRDTTQPKVSAQSSKLPAAETAKETAQGAIHS
jgi:hypothetical protein